MHLLSLSTQGLSYFNPFRKYSKRVLLIRPDKLGDFLISLSSCHQACAYYHSKGYTISLAVSPDLAELAKQCPLFDEIIICDLNAMSQSRSYRLSIYRKLYSLHPEITINLLMVLKHTVLSDYMACMSKAKITAHASYPIKEAPNIIFPDTFNWIERWESLYNCAITYDTEKSLLENETSLMGKACGVVFTPKLFNLDFLSLPDSQLPKNYYLVSPGGQSRIPWPAERYAKLIDLIYEIKPELIPVISGIESEKEIGDKIFQCVRHNVPIINIIGKSTFNQLFTNIKNAEFMLTNDTGTVHVAPLFGTKTFCITGVGQFGCYVPNLLYANTVFIYKKLQCMNCNYMCNKMVTDIPPCLDQVSAKCAWNYVKKYVQGQLSQ